MPPVTWMAWPRSCQSVSTGGYFTALEQKLPISTSKPATMWWGSPASPRLAFWIGAGRACSWPVEELRRFPELAQGWSMLVTFNGLSFDISPSCAGPFRSGSRRWLTSTCGTRSRASVSAAASRRSNGACRVYIWRVPSTSLGSTAETPAGSFGAGGRATGSLHRFAEYNLYDVINLRTLAAYAYNALVEAQNGACARRAAPRGRCHGPGPRRRALRRLQEPARVVRHEMPLQRPQPARGPFQRAGCRRPPRGPGYPGPPFETRLTQPTTASLDRSRQRRSHRPRRPRLGSRLANAKSGSWHGRRHRSHRPGSALVIDGAPSAMSRRPWRTPPGRRGCLHHRGHSAASMASRISAPVTLAGSSISWVATSVPSANRKAPSYTVESHWLCREISMFSGEALSNMVPDTPSLGKYDVPSCPSRAFGGEHDRGLAHAVRMEKRNWPV